MESRKSTDTPDFVQAELDSMAADVPEMPDAFRNGWRKAIRAEAAKGAIAEAENESAPRTEAGQNARTEAMPDSGPAAEKAPVPKKPLLLRSRRWTGILSAAAALIFLIGGTLVTRGRLSPRLRVSPAVLTQSAEDIADADLAMGMEASAPAENWSISEEVRQDAAAQLGEEGLRLETTSDQAKTMVYQIQTPEEETEEETEEAAPAPEAGEEILEEADAAVEADEEIVEEAAPVAEADEKIAEEADYAVEADAEIIAGEDYAAAADAGITAGADFAAEAPAASAAAPTFATQIGWFLEDMVAFLRAALPYLIIAGLAACAVLRFRKR